VKKVWCLWCLSYYFLDGNQYGKPVSIESRTWKEKDPERKLRHSKGPFKPQSKVGKGSRESSRMKGLVKLTVKNFFFPPILKNMYVKKSTIQGIFFSLSRCLTYDFIPNKRLQFIEIYLFSFEHNPQKPIDGLE